MAFDYNTLVTDRTEADVKAQNAKGVYRAEDLARVGEALAQLSQTLNRYGYAQRVSFRVDWTAAGWLNPGTAAVLLRDLATIRSTLALPSGMPKVPGTMERLGFETANDIERILLTVSQLIRLLEQARKRCGSFGFFCGTIPLPVWGDATPMRTWAELDQLGLTWADWDQMTWSQLLYG